MKRSLRSMTALPVGFFSVFDGLKMTLTTKGLRRFLIFPFVLNILLLGFCLYGAVEYLYPLLQSILPQGGAWYLALLRYLAKPLFILATMIITALAYSISGMIICAPFADPLSEKVEYLRTGRRVDSPISFARIIKSIVRTIKNTIGIMSFIIAFDGAILILNLIPVVGSVLYTIIGVLSLMLFLGFQCYDISLERHGATFGSKFGIMWRYKWVLIGIGMAFIVLSYIPIVGFLAPIVSTAGATSVYCRVEKGE